MAFDIVKPHLIRQEAKTLVQAHAEIAVLNEKLTRSGQSGPLISESVDNIVKRINAEAIEIEKTAAASKDCRFVKWLKSKFQVSARTVRIMSCVLGAIVVGFLIWDLAANWGKMNTAGRALSIIAIVLECAIIILDIMAIALPAVACIPIIGQVLMVVALLVGIFLILFGSHRDEPLSSGEQFVEKMSNGWVKNLDSPPTPLLTYTVSPTKLRRNSDSASLAVTVENKTSQDITWMLPSSDLATQSLSSTQVASVEFGLTSGKDEICLFSQPFQPSESSKQVVSPGKWSVELGSQKLETKLLAPNGTNESNTEYSLRLVPPTPKMPDTPAAKAAAADPAVMIAAAPIIFAKGSSITMKVEGKVGNGKTDFSLTIREARPGAPAALKVVSIGKD